MQDGWRSTSFAVHGTGLRVGPGSRALAVLLVLRTACNKIVPDIAEAIYALIGSFDPEFQAQLRRNIILAGGGSRLSGLPLLLEKQMEELGGGNVVAIEEPTYAGSNGALKLAMDMPAENWETLSSSDSTSEVQSAPKDKLVPA